MKLVQHPEYKGVYLRNQEAFQRCQEAITQWKKRDDIITVPTYPFQWTYESALSFVHALSQLFQEYNRVIWDNFNYCRECRGQCCVSGASTIRSFDLLAVALLDQSIPVFNDDITARSRECIYLSHSRCSWPEEWRTTKCWLFYCLGPGISWKPGASISEMRGEVASKLQKVVRASLPEQLRLYENAHHIDLADYLNDPLSFAEALNRALDKIFVAPFTKIYPLLATPLTSTTSAGTNTLDIFSGKAHSSQRTRTLLPSFEEQASAFLAEAVEYMYEHEIIVPEELHVTPAQFLEDLETLQWILQGHPSQRSKLLHEMSLRYANAPAPGKNESPTLWYRMRDLLSTLLRSQPVT